MFANREQEDRMNKIFKSAGALLLVVTVGLLGMSCNSSASSDHTRLSFDIPAGGTKSFSVYLHDSDVFHFSMLSADGGDLFFTVTTPSGAVFGSSSRGSLAGGTLVVANQGVDGFPSYSTSFSPSDYGWGQGNYSFAVNSGDGGKATVEYWVGE